MECVGLIITKYFCWLFLNLASHIVVSDIDQYGASLDHRFDRNDV